MILQLEQAFSERVETNTVYLLRKNNYLPSSKIYSARIIVVPLSARVMSF